MLSKIKWLWDRWRVMQHPQEEIYRLHQQIQFWLIDYFWYYWNPKCAGWKFEHSVLYDHSVWGLKEIINNCRCNINEFRILNRVIKDILSNTKWNYDFKNGKDAPCIPVHHINDFAYENTGEIKYIYELSRMYYLPMIAAYGIAKENDEYLNKTVTILKQWVEQNPFLSTIAWKSGNVVGIRAVNLVYYRSLLDLCGWDCREVDEVLEPLIALHYKFLLTHQSLYSSKGNHHLGELAGLIAISASYSIADRHLSHEGYVNELESETLRLINTEGLNREQALRYQASYINLVVTSVQIARSRKYVLSELVVERIKQMYTMLNVFRVGCKSYMTFGDEDNAELLFPYFDKEYDEFESMLNDRAILYGEKKKEKYHLDLRNYLLFGDKATRKYQTVLTENDGDNIMALYNESGYQIVKDNRIALSFDFGEIGIKPTMAHGHSDILSFNLFVGGKPIIVDCGSYQYNAHFKKMREYFHGVHSHNTLSIDGKDQAIAGEGMFWLSYPNVFIDDYEENNDYVKCTAHHDGYVRKGMNAIHQRTMVYHKKTCSIEILDKIKTVEKHQGEYTLHFHPNVKVIHQGNSLLLDDKIIVKNEWFKNGYLMKGNEEKPMGWYSERYDSIEPTYSFVLPFDIDGETHLETSIIIK